MKLITYNKGNHTYTPILKTLTKYLVVLRGLVSIYNPLTTSQYTTLHYTILSTTLHTVNCPLHTTLHLILHSTLYTECNLHTTQHTTANPVTTGVSAYIYIDHSSPVGKHGLASIKG